MSLLSNIIGALGPATVLPIIEQTLLAEAASQGETGIERAILLPQNIVQQTCNNTGADFNKAIQLRDAAAKAEADFLVYLATAQEPSSPSA